MMENAINLLVITSVVKVNDKFYVPPSSNESVAMIYPRLITLREDTIRIKSHVVTVTFHKCLSDAEVTKICEALSHESFIRMIQEKIEKDEEN